MKLKQIIVLLCVIGGAFLVACGGQISEADVEATVAAALNEAIDATADAVAAAEEAAIPTETLPPTETPEPTETLPPTETPAPTETPEPTFTPTPAAPIVVTALDDGQLFYDFIDEAFTIAITDDWSVLQIDATVFDAALQGVIADDDSLSEVFSSELFRDLVAAGIKFYAVNTTADSVDSGNPASINILRQSQSSDLSTADYAELLTTQLAQFVTLADETEIEQSRVELGDDTAVKIVYVSQLVNPLGEALLLHTTQYVLVENGNSYIVSITVPDALVDSLLPEAEQIGESFRLK